MEQTTASGEEKKPVEIKKIGLSSVALGLILLGAAAVGAISAGGVFFALGGSDKAGAQKTVVLNTDKISRASIKQIVEDKTLSNDQAKLVGQKLAANMKMLASDYQAKGYTIIDSRALMVWPSDVEITAQFAEKLGVKLD